MDKLTSMNVFVRVAKAGSFAGGARDLGISRAMATKHIMQLESNLGTRLFNRTTRSLSLTEVGSQYLERCQQVLGDVEEMEAAVTHLQTEPRGVLKISAPPVIGATHISRALAEFLKIHPDLTVDMILQGSPGDLIDEGIDLAIHLGALEDTSMVARKLASSSLVVCGSPEYLEQYGIPQTPEDLVRHSCLVNWAIPPRDKWQFKGETGYTVMNVSGRMQANAAHPIRIAAINGLGLVMLPTYIVGSDIEKGKLKLVLENYTLPPLDIHAVYPHRKYLSAKVRSFMDFLQEWLEHRVSMPGTE
ncbi:MAG: LysR family transcriptional regulator [Methylobacter sp.]|uniref:LysR family transcriptional regulator n=1 Tax=Methylobacter TaxID=429 RepID=UPI00036AB59A|nr:MULTISPECIES: LysR family transcriptional regulator [Methylobacter]MCL7420732.1 LysR family transcriptional regulator [Methylobacter sp.]